MYNVEQLREERLSKEYKEKLESALQAVETSDRESCVMAVKRMAEEIIGFEEKRQWKGWCDQECEKATQKKMLPT
jgi:PAS domain-containing protein